VAISASVCVFDFDGGVRLDEITVHVAERDRAELRRHGRARHESDPRDRQPGSLPARRGVSFNPQRNELPHDTALTAVQHADDDFLPDVTALRQ
jgi:hypothetical protein